MKRVTGRRVARIGNRRRADVSRRTALGSPPVTPRRDGTPAQRGKCSRRLSGFRAGHGHRGYRISATGRAGFPQTARGARQPAKVKDMDISAHTIEAALRKLRELPSHARQQLARRDRPRLDLPSSSPSSSSHSRHGGVRSRRGIGTVEAGTAVGRTRTRQAVAVRIAARPRPRAGHSTGCGADRRKQFRFRELRRRYRDAHTSPPPPSPSCHSRISRPPVSSYGVAQHRRGHDRFVQWPLENG